MTDEVDSPVEVDRLQRVEQHEGYLSVDTMEYNSY